MCYLVRQLPTEGPVPEGVGAPPLESLRPRWAGAAAAMLVAGVALAATLVSPNAGPDRVVARDPGAAAPVAQRSADLTAGGRIEKTALRVDDDVPTAVGPNRAGLGHCHQGL